FGFNSGVINQPRQAISKCDDTGSAAMEDPNCIPMDDWQWGIFVSIFLLGGVAGALPAGQLATWLGRRRVLLLNNVAFLVAGLLQAQASGRAQLYAGRLAAGLGAGVGTVVLPLYLAEVAPVRLRGSVGSLNQLLIVTGVLSSQLCGLFLSSRPAWRVLLGLTIVPSVLQIFALPLCEETPSWLASHGLLYDARKSLVALRGPQSSTASIDGELGDIFSAAGVSGVAAAASTRHADAQAAAEQGVYGSNGSSSALASAAAEQPLLGGEDVAARHTTSAAAAARRVTAWNLFSIRALRRPLFAAFMLQVAQQLSGINAAVYYSS
ncbi:Solute carrier 2, facilitated glucose transporter member 4, partial [Cladochytrium tenue]